MNSKWNDRHACVHSCTRHADVTLMRPLTRVSYNRLQCEFVNCTTGHSSGSIFVKEIRKFGNILQLFVLSGTSALNHLY